MGSFASIIKLFIFLIFVTKIFGSENVCGHRKCVNKCCPLDKYVPYRKKQCVSYIDILSLNSSIPIYDDDINNTGKKLEDVFSLQANAFSNVTFKINAFETTDIGFRFYLTKSGLVHLELPNAFRRWISRTPDKYCFDFVLPVTNSTTKPAIGIWVTFDDEGSGMATTNSYFTASMIISCVFFILVLVVYGILPELRNLGGMILMAYVFSLNWAFIFLMAMQMGTYKTPGCVALTTLIYFFLLSSFFWMNIMSYDIWWTFRGYAKARPIHRRGEWFKFLMYCLYAWGVPLLMSIGLVVLNEIDLTHVPWLITPKIPDSGCFLEGGERLVYLYTPMMILICLNWLFFIMTAFNIWRLRRGTAVLDSAAAGNPAAHRSNRYRFLVYLKLSVLMGLNWVMEVVSFYHPDMRIWWFTDAYNLLMGLVIFLIFVCKKKILKKLLIKFRHGQSKWRSRSAKSRSSRSSSTTESCSLNSSLEAQLQISTSPGGPMLLHNTNGYATVSIN